MTQTIRALATLGMYLFPVDHPDLPHCVGRHAPDKPCNGERGKHPVPLSWARESTTDHHQLNQVFTRGPRNVGIDCGRSGLVVLDEDAPGELDRLCAEHGQSMPETFTVSTGKGRHMYFRQPADRPFTNAPGGLRDYRIDVRGRGGYVVGPGSKHATGRTYSLSVVTQVTTIPQWVAQLLRPPAPPPRHAPRDSTATGSRPTLVRLVRVVLNAPEGQRNTTLNWAAYRMFEKVADGQLAETSADMMLLDAASAIGLPEGEARSTIGSARRAVLG